MTRIVWLYQHPSHKDTWKEYNSEDTAKLESHWHEYCNNKGAELCQLNVGHDGVPVMVCLKAPMEQYSPANLINRKVRRLIEFM